MVSFFCVIFLSLLFFFLCTSFLACALHDYAVLPSLFTGICFLTVFASRLYGKLFLTVVKTRFSGRLINFCLGICYSCVMLSCCNDFLTQFYCTSSSHESNYIRPRIDDFGHSSLFKAPEYLLSSNFFLFSLASSPTIVQTSFFYNNIFFNITNPLL